MTQAYYFCGCLHTIPDGEEIPEECPNRSCGDELMEVL